jgi:predicted DNA-binding transcriptional regulator YafY
MKENELSRLSRLVALITQLQTRRLLTATELAERFAVSVRTICRDMKALEAAGVPIVTEEGRGYSLLDGYRLPPITFTETEANALITAEKLVLQNKDASFVREFSEAINKVRAVLRTSTREKANRLADRMKFYPSPSPDPTSAYLSTLQQALTNHVPVRIAYRDRSDEESTRVVEPFALLNTHDDWLLVAWCRLRNAYRMFRLDRIQSLSPLPETFEPHDLTLRDYFEYYGK